MIRNTSSNQMMKRRIYRLPFTISRLKTSHRYSRSSRKRRRKRKRRKRKKGKIGNRRKRIRKYS